MSEFLKAIFLYGVDFEMLVMDDLLELLAQKVRRGTLRMDRVREYASDWFHDLLDRESVDLMLVSTGGKEAIDITDGKKFVDFIEEVFGVSLEQLLREKMGESRRRSFSTIDRLAEKFWRKKTK